MVSQSLTPSRQLIVLGIVLTLIAGSFGLAYYWFFGRDYAVLVTGVRPEESAAIVEELKKDNVAFELKDGGTTVLVPASRVDVARVDIAGGDLPVKGTVGFELFNQSDMGLTDFAQKVNYQRALQGEIARTIMAMDGIAYARVHLAIPERSLFRNATSEPRAAVTLAPKPGSEIGTERIAGIQRLVAAAVPDLALDQIAVLNERGELLTPEFSDIPLASSSPGAIEMNYRERVLRAASEIAPRAHLEVRVTLVPRPGIRSASELAAGLLGETPPPRGQAIRIVVFERTPLSLAQEQALRSAIETDLALSASTGDALSFSPAPEIAAPLAVRSNGPLVARALPDPSAPNPFMAVIARAWAILFTGLAAIGLVVLGMTLKRRSAQRRTAFATRIREQILLIESPANVA